MNNVKITDIKVTLCDTRVKGNFADSTRQVETIGFAVVEVETNSWELTGHRRSLTMRWAARHP